MKNQHYLVEKNLFLSLSGMGEGELLSPKSLGLNTGIFLGGERGFPSSAGLFGRHSPPSRSLANGDSKNSNLYCILLSKRPLLHALTDPSGSSQGTLLTPFYRLRKTGGRWQVIWLKPRALNNGGSCESGEGDSGPTTTTQPTL